MKAVVIPRKGSPDIMEWRETEDPRPGSGEILVRVRAAGVNFADVLARLGIYDAAPPPPFVPGIEVSGVVEAAAEDVEHLYAGDRIMAFCPFGGYAERVAVPAAYAARIPDAMGFPEAASLPVQYLTAWYGLHHLAGLRREDTVLVHAAAGGTGVACLQFCRRAGARVFATIGSESKRTVVEEECPGARVILYREEDFAAIVREDTEGRGPSLVMDSVGGWTFRRGWKILAPGGRYVLFGAASAVRPGGPSLLGAIWRVLPMLSVNPLSMIGSNKGLFGYNLFHLAGEAAVLAPAMDRILGLWADGALRPRIGLSLPMDKAAEAHRRMQDRSTTGKIILTL